ncbi:MAG: hypothetical protein JWM11_2473 [Planctomycetaceae bacterium]|nr:hypothetical protein [Planctomycetaceae bacterium]
MVGFKALALPVTSDVAPRCTIGGRAKLPSEIDVPRCRKCSAQLLLFLQFDIDCAWCLPFVAESHLAVFMCPQCNEIPSFEFPTGQLPAQYWDKNEGHFFAVMSKPSSMESVRHAEPILVTKELQFEPMAQDGHAPDTIRVGGNPFWLQGSERFVCTCGSEMAFVAQIAENFEFEKQVNAPEQPDSFSSNAYCLFLGNEVYIFACPEQCNSRSVWITVQG